MKKILKLMVWVMLMGLPVVMTSCEGLVTAFNDNPISPGLKVTTPSIQVEKGKTFKCNAKASSRTNLVYASADPSIATVDSYGIITGVAEGKTSITITTEGKDSQAKSIFTIESVTIPVEVTAAPEEEDEEVAVTSVTLNKTLLTPTIGAAPETLTATVAPDNATDKTVTWKSSNTSVATVDATGKVTFVAVGSATITCTATNGTEETGDDVEATCEVFVNEAVDLSTITSGTIEGCVALTGTLGGNYELKVADGATVTLDGMTINGVNNDAYKHAGLAFLGNGTIILKGVNKVTGFHHYYPGIYVAPDKTLTIKGDGQLTASCSYLETDGAAGIGCGVNLDCGNIVIESGTIIAEGAAGAAGIGGGEGGSCGDITIHGGDITASSYGGAAIGVASGNVTGGDITITGGTIKAEIKGNHYGVAIGGGQRATVGKITITGGDITATGGSVNGVGIGAYTYGKCGDINISGGKIVATGSNWGAGIGSCLSDGRGDSECGNITITGGDITATGGQDAAGIGSGMYSTVGKITITGGDITATGGAEAAGIGTGKSGAADASKCGDITITAGVTQVTATCAVTVTVAVTSVTLSKDKLAMTIGEDDETLTATVKPDDATDATVTWTSDKETVATVADGVVHAVAVGTAIITAKAGDKTATCVVTVNRINVTSVTLEPATLTPTIGDAAVTLTATVAPDNATNKTVTWKSSDETVATVDDNGKVTFVAVGTATITCTATNGTEETTDDKEKTCPVTVSYQLLSAATTTDVGKVVCAAGHLHTAKTAVPTGCTAVGILGKVMQTGHGLILALQDATPQTKSTFSGSGWRTMTLNRENIHLKNLPDAAALGSLTSYTTLGSIAVNDWSMTTQKTYSEIFTNLGSTTDGTYKNYDDNVNDYITNGVGGTGLAGTYWAIDMCFNGTSWEDASETCQYNIRPILSF